MVRIHKTPEPFQLEGLGERATTRLLLIHGFASTASEFRKFAYFMNDFGYSVHALLLPGHGTSPEDMRRTKESDWKAHVLSAYDAIAALNPSKIVVIGHSMGALLALLLSAERRLDAVVSLAAPIYLQSRKSALAPLAKYFIPYIERKPTVAAQVFEESLAYLKTPVSCVVDLHKILKEAKNKLRFVQAPLFVGQGESDKLVAPKSAEFIFQKSSSAFKALRLYPGSSHAILIDGEREAVFADILQFLSQLEKSPS